LFFRVTFAVHVVLLGFSAIIGLSLLLVQVLGERSRVLCSDRKRQKRLRNWNSHGHLSMHVLSFPSFPLLSEHRTHAPQAHRTLLPPTHSHFYSHFLTHHSSLILSANLPLKKHSLSLKVIEIKFYPRGEN